jgi:NADH:ubiquinone oxidoreductase subunit 6 (subunit J)
VQVILFLILENFIYYILNLLIIFIEIGILLILLDNEFLAFLFLIIYAGAIIILFIFVLMLIDLKGVQFNYNFSVLKYLILFFIPIFILFYYLINLNLYSYVFFFNDDDTFWYYIQFNTIMFRTINFFIKFVYLDYLNDLVIFNDLTFLAYSLYNDFFLETCLLGYFILYCLIFITLLLIEIKKK